MFLINYFVDVSNVILQKCQRMKNALYVINGVLVVAVAVLFYLYFSEKKPSTVLRTAAVRTASGTGFKIGYFEWDSIANNFRQYQNIQNEVVQKSEQNDKLKMQLRSQYQNKLNGYSQKQLSQVESEAAAKDLKNLEIDITNKMQSLDNELEDFRVRRQNDIKTKISEFLKEYNKTKGYSYIFVSDPGFIFYKDTVYNITNDLVKGLNEKYPPAKKK